jgi:hypothetical protein
VVPLAVAAALDAATTIGGVVELCHGHPAYPVLLTEAVNQQCQPPALEIVDPLNTARVRKPDIALGLAQGDVRIKAVGSGPAGFVLASHDSSLVDQLTAALLDTCRVAAGVKVLYPAARP